MSLPLGVSLPPDSVHALSVSIPTWKDVVGYEEGKREVLDAMACGYPRFFVHPLVAQLTQLVQTREPFASFFPAANDTTANATAQPKWSLRVSPTRVTAERLRDFLIATAANDAALGPIDPQQDVAVANVCDVVYAVRFPQQLAVTAKQFWQHSGEIVTSRHAELALRVLSNNDDSSAATLAQLEMQHSETHDAVRAHVASLYPDGPSPQDVSLYPTGPSPQDVSLYPTGMAAIFASVRLTQSLRRSMTSSNDNAKSILVGFPYVDTLKILSRIEWCERGVYFFPNCGASELAEIAAILAREPITGIFTEFPGNPLLTTPDLIRLAALAHAHDTVLVVDDTIASYNVNVMQHGAADIVTTSLSKIFSGSCAVMGGSIVLNPQGAHYTALQQLLSHSNDAFVSLADARVLLSDSVDVLARLARVNATTSVIVNRLQAHPLVQTVFYPELQSDTTGFTTFLTHRKTSGFDSESDSETKPQFGPLLSIVLHGGLATAKAFYDTVDVAKGPSLGTNFTICSPYTLLAHYNELDYVESCGVDRHLLRLSIGLEDVESTWRVLEVALIAAQTALDNNVPNSQ